MKHFITTLIFATLVVASCFSQNYGNVNISLGPNGAGIDSSFVRNDSIFLALVGGGEVFSGLADVAVNQGRIWYVSKTGIDSTAQVGNIFKPAKNPFWLSRNKVQNGDIINISKGVYNVDSLFTNPFAKNGFSFRDSIIVNCDRGVVFSGSTNTNNTFVNDIGLSQYVADSVRNFTLSGFPSINYTALSGGGTEKVIIYLGNSNSTGNFQIANLGYSGVSSINSLIYFGGKKLNLNVENINTISDVIFRITGGKETGSTGKSTNRSISTFFNSVNKQSGGANVIGAFRWQGIGYDSLSNISININSYTSSGPMQSNFYFERPLVNSKLSYSVSHFNQLSSYSSKFNDYAILSTAGTTIGQTEILFAADYFSMKGSALILNFDYVITPNVFFGGTGGSSGAFTLDSSILILKIGKGMFTRSSPVVIKSQLTLRNNSKLIIECEDCNISNASAIWIDNPTLDATSSIEIRGKWRVTGANAVINTRAQVILDGATLLNDSSVPAIQSTVATNVIVKSAYTNSLSTDSDITELVNPIIKNSNVK